MRHQVVCGFVQGRCFAAALLRSLIAGANPAPHSALMAAQAYKVPAFYVNQHGRMVGLGTLTLLGEVVCFQDDVGRILQRRKAAVIRSKAGIPKRLEVAMADVPHGWLQHVEASAASRIGRVSGGNSFQQRLSVGKVWAMARGMVVA